MQPPYTPELLWAVQDVIRAFLNRHKGGARILELGGGYSTPWLAALGNLTTLEHDEAWYNEITTALSKCHLQDPACATVHLMPADKYTSWIASQPDQSYDLIYVDCVDAMRFPCCHTAAPKLAPNALMILDDTHWPFLSSAVSLLTRHVDPNPVVISGKHLRHDGEIHDHHTTIWRR